MGFLWFKSKQERIVDGIGLPPRVFELNSGPHQSGPNCWNATIMFFDPNEPVRYVDTPVMESWLKANTEEDKYKLSATGSILVLRDRKGELLHTAVYVGQGILWHKRGCNGYWEFITEKQLRRIYFEAKHFEHRILKAAL